MVQRNRSSRNDLSQRIAMILNSHGRESPTNETVNKMEETKGGLKVKRKKEEERESMASLDPTCV